MGTIKATDYTHRLLARFVIEAETPLAVSSGEKDITTDSLVATDVNGLPYIPGTAIAGVIRHAIEKETANNFFGFHETIHEKKDRAKKENTSTDQLDNIDCGSEIIFTDAKMLGAAEEVIDGLQSIDFEDVFYSNFRNLPIRQHVSINKQGVAEKHGKFDEQVVFAGTRFCFELEMLSQEEKNKDFEKVLTKFQNETFRIGGGTRSGFGKIKVVELYTRTLDLREPEELELYLEKSSKLSDEWTGWEAAKTKRIDDENWTEYRLTLNPEDFFLFGSGFGDEEADITPVKAQKVYWANGEGKLKDEHILIPATSLKGALAHRVAFHYNKLTNVFATKELNLDNHVGENNEAVKTLFGSKGESVNNKTENQLRGNVIFSDIIEKREITDKILNHVSIDRFTGGAIEGALFTEKTTFGKGLTFETKILVHEAAFNGNENIKKAFKLALNDIVTGMLPLGGGVNRGNGVFTGKITDKNGEPIQ